MEKVLSSGIMTATSEKICYCCKKYSIFIDGEEVEVFGITANSEDGEIDRICDIHTNEELVCGLCEVLNEQEVSALHFHEVVYDWVVESCL